MDESKYDRQIELVDMGEAEELAVKMIMQEGALRFQDLCLAALAEKNMPEAAKVIKAIEVNL
jgi:hypothetical protein